MAHFHHQGDRAVVFFSGELTVDAAVDLVETIEMLASVYFYAVVELVIASPGGSSMALDHYVDATRRWRDAGVVLRTRVAACAESAAALMLSLGDERLAEPRARLLYHPFRVIQPGSLTAYQSARMYADLARLDEAYLVRLDDRAMDGADAASVVSADVEPSDLQALDRLTTGLPAPAKGTPRTPRALARVTEVRPLSSLAPGECYAVLADGRFARRQLDPVLPAAPERTEDRRSSRRARSSREASSGERTSHE